MIYRPQSLHSSSDKVIAVMGMDVTLGYFYKMLLDNIKVCRQALVRCFLLNDDGYLIAHPSLVEPNGRGPVEELHITHKVCCLPIGFSLQYLSHVELLFYGPDTGNRTNTGASM